MATSQRAKELAHQVEHLTSVIAEMDDENYKLMVKLNESQEAHYNLGIRTGRLRKYITDNIEKGNQ